MREWRGRLCWGHSPITTTSSWNLPIAPAATVVVTLQGIADRGLKLESHATNAAWGGRKGVGQTMLLHLCIAASQKSKSNTSLAQYLH